MRPAAGRLHYGVLAALLAVGTVIRVVQFLHRPSLSVDEAMLALSIGSRSYGGLLRRLDYGQTAPVHSCSAGLDYPGVGPEHSFWKDTGRVRYTSVDDSEALEGFRLCARLEGILPALETAHAVVETMREAGRRDGDDVVVLCFSGRGDKDCEEVARLEENR